jgi:hypothetical protein
MAYWEVEFPTVTADARTGVQVFTYPAGRFSCRSDVIDQARKDVDSENAVRHRAGAVAKVEAIRAIWHDRVQ